MIEELLRDITWDYLKDTKIGANLQRAMEGLEKTQEVAYAYVSDASSEQLKKTKIGTTLVFAIMKKMYSGKSFKEFKEEDWKEIASMVAQYAILDDGKLYSQRVFSAYADYVDASVKFLVVCGVPEDKCDSIRNIAAEVRSLSDSFIDGDISEVEYTEQCLWLLLEAMIKLIATYGITVVGEDLAEFNQSVAMLAFEYGRYSLYRREQEILTEYLEHQEDVDRELEERLAEFKAELLERSKEFDSFIADAFDPDISKRLKSSVELARNAGVAEDEILDSVEKIDEFFM